MIAGFRDLGIPSKDTSMFRYIKIPTRILAAPLIFLQLAASGNELHGLSLPSGP